jgi:hypothetical protein
MRRATALGVLLGALAGCSSLPVTGDGVVGLVVRTPTTLTLIEGQTVQLDAVALDRDGHPVPGAEIVWATPDSTITVDPSTGLVTAVDTIGTGRVQASVGSLRSDLITFTLQPAT